MVPNIRRYFLPILSANIPAGVETIIAIIKIIEFVIPNSVFEPPMLIKYIENKLLNITIPNENRKAMT